MEEKNLSDLPELTELWRKGVIVVFKKIECPIGKPLVKMNGARSKIILAEKISIGKRIIKKINKRRGRDTKCQENFYATLTPVIKIKKSGERYFIETNNSKYETWINTGPKPKKKR